MIYFSQPIWIGAIAGIIIPVMIHLWNIKKGKTLKVGNIDFLARNSAFFAVGRKLSDLFLFLLRCLIVLALAFILMEPFFKTNNGTLNQKGWLLIAKKDIKQAYQTYPKTIDSLLSLGFAFHRFEKGFAESSLSDSTSEEDSANAVSYWALLQELDQQVPASLPVSLFTADTREHFTGTRPAVDLSLQWRTFTPRERIGQENKNALPVKNICIFSADTSIGGKYVSAALHAIAENTNHRIKLALVNNIDKIPENTQWLFWLSENKIPDELLKNNVLLYEKGTAVYNYSSFITTAGVGTTAGTLHLSKWVEHKQNTALTPVWTNAYGGSILAKEIRNTDTIYHFYSRFDPQWNDLVWNDHFPQILYDLVFNMPGDKNNIAGNTPMDVQQILPAMEKENATGVKQIHAATTDLIFTFWLLLFFLFLVERILTFTRKRREVKRG